MITIKPVYVNDPALVEALIGLLASYDEERQCIDVSPDCGCFECTVGTVPNHLNTGLCALHRAKAALAKTKQES